MTDKLLPCPHCGGKAKIEDPTHSPWIRCTGCGIRTAPYGWKQDAIKAWNRRAEDHNVQECAKDARWEEMIVADNADYEIPQWQSARCSACNKYYTTPYAYYFEKFPYCPNCGAKMEADDDPR